MSGRRAQKLGGVGVLISGADALRRKHTWCQENVPGVWYSINGARSKLRVCSTLAYQLYKMVILAFAV